MGESPKQRQMNLKAMKAQSQGLHRSVRHSKYRILGLVGQGQFGRVFCASVRETSPKQAAGQLVALKELSHQQAPTSEFLRELWFLITLQHPNIVTCRALEHTTNGRYLVMDYCEGGTLRNLLKQDRPLRLLESLQLVIGVLAGLDYTHRRGVVHCDIKPENILLTLGPKGWLPRLSDFGVARRLPEVGTVRGNQEISPDATVGSPAYMAPERFYGLYSPMSDIYAVGILLFEMLMGDRPFSGPPGKLMWAHLNQRLELPEIIPEPLQEILKKAMEKLPARRYASASQMAQALRLAMYDPKIRQWGDRIIPWRSDEIDREQEQVSTSIPSPNSKTQLKQEDKSNSKDSTANSSRSSDAPPGRAEHDRPQTTKKSHLIIAAPLTGLAASETYLYIAAGSKVRALCQPDRQPTPVTTPTAAIPETVQGLLPAPQGCYAIAEGGIYWLKGAQSYLVLPRSAMEPDAVDQSVENLATPKESDVTVEPQVTAQLNFSYKSAIDPENRWLAVAIGGELRFYSQTVESASSPDRRLSLARSLLMPEQKLPELIFLDRRHLLTIWSADTEQPQTTFRVYTRRGTLVGEVGVSVAIDRFVAGPEPYTLLGVLQGVKSAVLLIHLRPLKIKRIPLDTTPICTCATSWGYALADAQGQIVALNPEGCQIGKARGPARPQAMASWGKTGLTIATQTGGKSHLYFVDIEMD